MQVEYQHAVILILLLIVLYFVIVKNAAPAERAYNTPVDMTAARFPDPIWFKYMGRNKAWNGMDSYDYYDENDMIYKVGAGPELLGIPDFESRVKSEDSVLKRSMPFPPEVSSEFIDPTMDAFVGGTDY